MKEDIEQLKEKIIEEFDRKYDFSENKTLEYDNLLTIRDFILSKLSELEQAVREEDKELNRNVGGKHFMFLDEAGELSDEVWELLEKRLN